MKNASLCDCVALVCVDYLGCFEACCFFLYFFWPCIFLNRVCSPCLSVKVYSYLFDKGICGVSVFILEWDLKQSVMPDCYCGTPLSFCLLVSVCPSVSPSLSPSAPYHSHSLLPVISSPYLLPFSYYSSFLSLLPPAPALTPFISLSNFSASASSANPFVHYHQTVWKHATKGWMELNGWKEERLWAMTQFDGSFHEFSMSTES